MDALLKLGDLLTQNDGEGWFVVVEQRDRAFLLCRVPGGLLPKDYGHKFVHDPAATDPTAFALMTAPRWAQ